MDEARVILKKLSGKEHEVIAAVAFQRPNKESYSFALSTKVTFDQIEDDFLEIYLQSGDSLDKAGAYGIQGQGLSFIKSLQGSYSNVVGFPLSHFLKELPIYLGLPSIGWRENFV